MKALMRNLRQFLAMSLAAITVTSVLVGDGLLRAQPSPQPDEASEASEASEDSSQLPDITKPAPDQVTLAPADMLADAERLIDDMRATLTRAVEVQTQAREKKDIIRLNCVNDKVMQIKELLNIADEARNELMAAVTAGDEDTRYHHHNQVKIASESATSLLADTDACVGEELSFLGPTDVDAEGPDHPDDPTKKDPFDLVGEPININTVEHRLGNEIGIGEPIERPNYASPYR